MKIILHYIMTLILFVGIDALWLGIIAKDFYNKHLGALISPTVRWVAVVIFYLMYAAGILIFAVYPAIAVSSWRRAVLLGGLFGLFCYGTYELTNMATLAQWSWGIVLTDTLWGIFITSLVTVLSFLIYTNFLK